jgi:hypothetical protein
MHLWIPFCIGSLLLVGGAYAWWHYREHRFSVVSRGNVYRCAAMPPQALRQMVRRHGIRTVFDLRCPVEGAEKIAAEKETLESLGVHHVNLESPQVPTPELRDRYLAWVADPAHRPALIHCNHGEGRAVLYGALWRIEFEGVEPEKARKECRLITTRGSSFDPRRPKGAYLRSYQPVRKP